jgi:hypothetical protein
MRNVSGGGGIMDQAQLERERAKFEEGLRARVTGVIEKVELLQYGDAPEIEPGEVLARIVIGVPEGADTSDKEVRRAALDAFHDANREALHEIQKEFRNRGGVTMEATVTGTNREAGEHGPIIKMKFGGRPGPLGMGDASLTAVMARVGAEELETLDTLIAVGIASSRSEAVRWALARIRERPAYEQIRAHSRQIEELKAQF